ncbi:MAG: CAP domain-containing protein [bacterium]|nr:CAP domain-containing protein [bacterium]
MRLKQLLVTIALATFPVAAFAAPLSADRVFDLVNLERTQAGATPLKRNRFLDAAAASKARDLIKKQFFAHTGPDGQSFTSWVDTNAYPYTALGENLAMDFSNERATLRGWLGSTSHRTNLLDPLWRDSGIAAADGYVNLRLTNVVVQLFGTLTPLTSGTKPLLADGSVQGAASSVPSEQSNTTRAFTIISLSSLLLTIGFLSYARVHPRVGHALDRHTIPQRA